MKVFLVPVSDRFHSSSRSSQDCPADRSIPAKSLPPMQLLFGVLALPGTTLIFIPGIILWLLSSQFGDVVPVVPAHPTFWISLLLASTGLLLVLWTARLSITVGSGTPAPWDPPAKIVVIGPYGYVRNLMITGVVLVLAAESVFFGSWPLLVWMLAFFIIHAIYVFRFEEPGLERRYGKDYREYKARVPRWIPKWQPWGGTLVALETSKVV